MNLFLRLHRLRPSLSLYLTTPFHHLLSTAAIQAPPPNSQFAVVDYLIKSCGLSSDEAVKASKYICHLKSPDKPDAVLQFLRHAGIRESDIRTAVSRVPRILCSHMEKNWRPNVAKLQEIGLSTEDISGIISRKPLLFSTNFVQKVDYWMLALGSVENLYVILKRNPGVLLSNLEKVAMPNMSFLRDQLGLSLPQIIRLIVLAQQLITSSPENLKIKTKMAEELGVRCSSPMFVYALQTVSNVSQSNIDARLNNLKSLGLSQEEVTTLVSRLPLVLTMPLVSMRHKIEFLIKEVGCDTLYLVQNPCLLTLSLEKRHIPRNLVRKLLQSKGYPVANLKYNSFVHPTEKQFVAKFVLPYEHAIPGLHQAYSDACYGNIAELNGL